MRKPRGAARRPPAALLLLAALCPLLLASPARAQDGAPPAAPVPEAAPRPEAAPDGSGTAPDGERAGRRGRDTPPPYTVEIVAPDALEDLLEKYLDLPRFRDDPGLADITEGELSRLMSATPAQARSLLETEGYFTPEVEVTRQPGTPPRVRIVVRPGPRTTINRLTLEVQGPAQEQAAEGDARAAGLIESIREDWPMQEGEPFLQSEWTRSKGLVLSRLRAEGYPGASWSGTAAEIDAPASTARLFVVADSGPLYRFGPVRTEGLKLYREEAVVNLRGFSEGDIYRERLLLDYQERLQRSDLFQAATVVLDTTTETPEAAPVLVRVREHPLRNATLNLGYSDATGPRVGVEHTHRRVFGWHWIARSRVQLGQNQTTVESELISHPKPRLYRNIGAIGFDRFEGDSTRAPTREWRVRAGRRQEGERLERLYYAEYTGSVVTTPLGDSTAQALLGNYQWIWRRLDSIILPTEGYTLSAQAGAGYAHGSDRGSGPFTRLLGRLTWYRPLGGWYAQTRVEAGQVFAQDEIGVPEPLLFRAGGDDSVRGYEHRSIGPRVAGTVVGGRVLATASAEIARPFLERFPQLWGAFFIDAGAAADTWGALDPVLGYGIGARYRSPVGPLRVDLAYGQQERSLRLHISVGIAF
ncbi:autotransporter assembly complex protein TamA [Caldimonas tepidiphila]|uniref:autotransporter assembly complex protein TamA n=1 Tax=Caldimonas tepidiphila TaxID=2315841 RepID=UPI000E5AA14E|nr:BamA/TamA family outer membrane protein [Caldimonas tepidiphila]